MRLLLMLAVLAGLLGGSANAGDKQTIILQSTTSTRNSGLLDAILPQFTRKTGIVVKVVAVGTGQALKNARNGDGDVLLVHARAAEDAFVAAGYGIDRRDVMYNDFVLVGPTSDPAGLSKATSVGEALKILARGTAPFVSRGDDSGTHKKERKLWKTTGLDVISQRPGWYRESGAGMGATLNIAAGMGAYTLSDRATWLAFKNRATMKIVFEGDKSLHNQYGVIRVNPARYKHINAKGALMFVDWITGKPGQELIANFKLDGQQLFFPNAKRR